jgi:hypothetical protein
MKIPFSLNQFLEVFAKYNNAVWPMQLVLNTFAGIIIFFCFSNRKNAGKIVSSLLGFLWLWTGAIYHLVFFTSINKAAYLFGALFILQGLLFLQAGVIKDQLLFKAQEARFKIIAACVIAFALIIYPLFGIFLGHVYPNSPTFGLPCPLTIFTFGCFLMIKNHFPFYLLIIPFSWSIIGLSASYHFGFMEDISLPVVSLLSIILILFNRKQQSKFLINKSTEHIAGNAVSV